MQLQSPVWILAVLALNVAISEWLVRRTPLRHLGSALLVIVLTAIVANLGVIPTYSDEILVYTGIFEYVAPLAIFLLVLRVHLAGLLRAGRPMLLLFGLGAVGTTLGVLAGMQAVGGSEAFGELHYALGGMFVGTYTGGSINFNAVALEYGVVKDGALYAGAAAVDSAATTVWMVVTVALPRLVARGSGVLRAPDAAMDVENPEDEHHDEERVGPLDLALLTAMGAGAVWISNLLADAAGDWLGVSIPSILILTTLALVLAQLPAVQKLRGARVSGWLAVMVFLAVIGALCDVGALRAIGPLAGTLVLFVTVIIVVHGAVVFGLGALFRADPAMSAVASQANIGGSTSALALAKSLGRGDLMLPGILVGALGNAAGTYLGFLAAAWLR
jgi:uncharacterized membrane protein